MRAFGRHAELGIEGQLAFVMSCRWSGRLYDLGSFPGAVPGDGALCGELFRVRDPRAWCTLDRYEGARPGNEEASLFVRRRVSMAAPAGRTAWVYWYNGAPEERARVPSGDWAAYVEGRGRS
jgi:gamma-glutamylcyclotransferase (GGCT)/AIG2-like uncharacterized protein YtfP